MIQLIKLIPEIKILSNNIKPPKIGDWYIDTKDDEPGDRYEFEIINIDRDNDIIEYKFYVGIWEDENTQDKSYNKFIKMIRDNQIRLLDINNEPNEDEEYLDEIKIHPNTNKNRAGDIYYDGKKYLKILHISVNNEIYYLLTYDLSIVKSSQINDWNNSYSLGNFEKYLKNNNFKKLNLTEIKINPRNKIITNNQLYDFLESNLEDFVKFLDDELGWNIAIFDNELDYVSEKDWIYLETIGDNNISYTSWVSLNKDQIDFSDNPELSKINYKNVEFYIAVY